MTPDCLCLPGTTKFTSTFFLIVFILGKAQQVWQFQSTKSYLFTTVVATRLGITVLQEHGAYTSTSHVDNAKIGPSDAHEQASMEVEEEDGAGHGLPMHCFVDCATQLDLPSTGAAA